MSPPLLSGPPDAKKSSRFVAKTLGLVGAVILLTLAAAIYAMTWATDAANRLEAERQRGRVDAALNAERSDLTHQLHGLLANETIQKHLRTETASDILSAVLALEAQRSAWFDGIIVWDVNGSFRAGVQRGTQCQAVDCDVMWHESGLRAAGTNAQNEQSDVRPSQPAKFEEGIKGRSQLLVSNDRLLIVANVPIDITNIDATASVRSYAISGYRTIDNSRLNDIAKRHSISNFKLKSEPSPNALSAIAVKNATGAAGAWLVWSSERPGDGVLLSFVIVIFVSLGICLSVFVAIVSRLRRSALQMAMREDEIQRLAGHDPLSGLPNRKAFEITIDRELLKLSKDGGGFAVHFLDLDKFKAVNDTYGHKAGDELIRQVAKRLTDLLRGADTLVRFGGDEFAIVQTEVTKAGEAAMLGQRILEALTRPFTIDDIQVLIGVSIGISLAPQNGTDRETLANLADTALYQAKNEGRNRYNFFEKMMDKSLHLRRVVEDDLRNAIDNDELTLHYQPQISADGQTIVGIEALVRWPHALHGMIPPTEFIPIAEERGLIMQLSDWVLRRACIDGRRWPGLRLAVNVSPIQFRHHEFVANVAAVLSETGFDGSRLEIELTEGVVVDDADKAEAAMVELRALGVGLALDDFGTGYSSLIYLRRFAFDKIKIDRSFLEYMETTGESAILVHSVVHLGRALGLRVCAEGVETAEQHRFLQAVGCHELQGFFFSPPVPADAIDHLLSLEHPFAARTA
jgi:diguanylate cyclase (GGDEF)-like protein